MVILIILTEVYIVRLQILLCVIGNPIYSSTPSGLFHSKKSTQGHAFASSDFHSSNYHLVQMRSSSRNVLVTLGYHLQS